MKEAIETRELIVLDGLDVITRGTYHKTCEEGSGVQPNPIERGSVGVLFLNSPSPTRAAQGDSAVYWADSFAELGYPSFRLDLPGFGDSEGDPTPELLDFISQGGYAPIVSAKIRELVTRFNLEGVVIVVQCSTSISTIYATACCLECKGLVLLNPSFDLPHESKSQNFRYSSDGTSHGCRRISQNPCISLTQTRQSPGTILSGKATGLHRRLKDKASTELQILVFTAAGVNTSTGEAEYFRYIVGLTGRNSQIVIKMLDESDSSFTSRLGRMIIRKDTEQWLNNCFPLATHTEALLTPHLPEN